MHAHTPVAQARRSASRFIRFYLRSRQILFELSAKVESLTACTWGGRVLLVGC